MPLKRETFTIYLAESTGPPTDVAEVETEVTFADQLRGEKEAFKQGVSLDLPLNMTVVMCWCALVREGKYTKDFQTFKAAVRDIQKHKGEEVEVDPTQPAASTEPSSPSPTGSPASPPTSG